MLATLNESNRVEQPARTAAGIHRAQRDGSACSASSISKRVIRTRPSSRASTDELGNNWQAQNGRCDSDPGQFDQLAIQEASANRAAAQRRFDEIDRLLRDSSRPWTRFQGLSRERTLRGTHEVRSPRRGQGSRRNPRPKGSLAGGPCGSSCYPRRGSWDGDSAQYEFALARRRQRSMAYWRKTSRCTMSTLFDGTFYVPRPARNPGGSRPSSSAPPSTAAETVEALGRALRCAFRCVDR